MERREENGGKRKCVKKSQQSNWKEKLRLNCLKRVQADRSRLLWNLRSSRVGNPPLNHKEIVESAFRDIVSDELNKITQSSSDHARESSLNDVLWEYDGPRMSYQSIEGDCEELMIEMESLFYRDLMQELTLKELEVNDQSLKEEEDYLAQAVYEHMQLTDDQVGKDSKIWCPICKKGELRENHHLIFCTCCKLQIDTQSDKVTLDYMCVRLGEVLEEHLDRGCKAMPNFCTETRFKLTALYIQCQACNTFEIVM